MTVGNHTGSHSMEALRLLGLLLIGAHCIVALWHLILAAKIIPGFPAMHMWLPFGLVTAVHCGVCVVWWKCSNRLAGLVLLVFLVTTLGLGSYEHLLSPGPNNLFRIAPGEWTAAFRASVAVLSVLEVLGCWLAIRLLKSKSRNKNQSGAVTGTVT